MRSHRARAFALAVSAAAPVAIQVNLADAHGAAVPTSFVGAATAWSLDGPTILVLFAMLASYRAGLGVLRRTARNSVLLARPRVVAGHLAIVILAFALLSPVDVLAGSLLSAHMLQHVLLLFVVAPLLVMARVDDVALVALPQRLRRTASAALNRSAAFWLHPFVVGFIFAAVVWLWHLPGPYDAAENHAPLHSTEHATMLLAAVLWFRVALHSAGTRTFGFPLALAWIAATMLQLTALSGLMAFSDHPWYSTYAHASGEWPLDAVADQQLAGVIMWLFGTPMLLATTLRLVARWFTIEERRARREVVRALGPGRM